ncbi:TniQ family protein [Polynucleobacter sp. JS-Safj-400b-B2]|uniref:TniQ family protein n=1 Tax=Polynucleobacter sp. JS-Safj-400b-B2 TaxID=2576921 RepID=UPI001C0E1213|nr:TniQ family protein [Polynucleobacter sp. JS-Safj-400b-B2]MBU3625521.1 TniQ family protein [Polynucleobacter sp. JS-Safj-400b-B2]
MRGLTSPLWPIHFKPLPDELLSSWLVRLAHSHGLKVQTFCNLIFGNRLQVWNRDIDRLAPDWLIRGLSDRTGAAIDQVMDTTLQSYQGIVYHRHRASGTLSWIQSLRLHHRKFEGFGLQFCPECLAQDKEPYFRKSWRVAFNTVCTIHNCMLNDRCPYCGHGVAFHRNDMRRNQYVTTVSLKECHYCGIDLSKSPTIRASHASSDVSIFLGNLSRKLQDGSLDQSEIDNLLIMHHFTKLIFTSNPTVKLYSHLCNIMDVDEIALDIKADIEGAGVETRHLVLQLIAYLMLDLGSSLREAIEAKAIRYNHLKRDFNDMPSWYMVVIGRFSNWRTRNLFI